MTHTLTELESQFVSWHNTLTKLSEEKENLFRVLNNNKNQNHLFYGCGSSYNLALSFSYLWNCLHKTHSFALPASEVILFPEIINNLSPTMVVPISRSGETSETILATDKLHSKGLKSLGITCNSSSTLAKITSTAITTSFIEEKSVVETVIFSALYLTGLFYILFLSEKEALFKKIFLLPENGKFFYQKTRDTIIKTTEKDYKQVFILGSGPYYGIARDSCLKIMEMSLLPTNAFNFLEFRHGPIASVGKDSLIIALLSSSNRSPETQVINEVKKYGADTLVLDIDAYRLPEAESSLMNIPDMIRSIIYAPPIQLFACLYALKRGLNPDHPPHLERVVNYDYIEPQIGVENGIKNI